MHHQLSKCTKFIPNTFTKNKCQNCFCLRDNHSPEALEFSKCSRKVVKYGYLFVAPPDLDINKTKRWQWRFFVLYDDGELTYALDDNPLTVPQGHLNINKCKQVLDATLITGQPNSLQLEFFQNDSTQINESYFFIAGSGLDDIIKWKDALICYCCCCVNNKINSTNLNSKSHSSDYENLKNKNTQMHNQQQYNEYSIQHQQQSSKKPYNNNYLISKSEPCVNINENELNEEVDVNDENDNCNMDDLINDNELLLIERSKNDHTHDNEDTSEEVNKDKQRRLSYKEDDFLRKQRLKENFNQLLIEYKHEEEKFKKATNTQYHSTTNVGKNQRQSLDSHLALSTINKTKSSLLHNNKLNATQINSAFKPVVANANEIKHKFKKNNDDSSSSSSYSSSSSSWSSTSSSNSPPKTRSHSQNPSSISSSTSSSYATRHNTNTATNTNCSSSPRSNDNNKTTVNLSSNCNDDDSNSLSSPSKSLTILLRNNSIDEGSNHPKQVVSSSPKKTKDETTTDSPTRIKKTLQPQKRSQTQSKTVSKTSNDSTQKMSPKTKNSSMELIRTGYLYKLNDKKHWDKYWFSLNNSILIYWNEKIEQDLAKVPVGKVELLKCIQIVIQDESVNDNYIFQLHNHQNNSSISFKAITSDVKNNWIQALKQSIEQSNSFCLKCKPKLVVNPLQLTQDVTSTISLLAPIESNGEINAKSIPASRIDEMTAKTNQTEAANDSLLDKLNSSRTTYDFNMRQIKSLNDQLLACKETIKLRDIEISKLKTQLETYEKDQVNSNEGWNKEVRNLDARINDVLGKIKERELLLTNYDDWERKYKDLEKSHTDVLNDLNRVKLRLNDELAINDKLRINIKKLMDEKESLLVQQHAPTRHQEQQQKANRKLSLQDFDDDLGKVLMSKEEVITQLEKSLVEKDKCITQLSKQLNEQTQLKTNEIDHLKDEIERLNGYIDDLEKECDTMKVSSETTKNEIDFLQEEIKTLEFKFAHSQRETSDFKSLLDASLRNHRKVTFNSIETQTGTCKDENLLKLERELNEAKEENLELSDHLYALDEFMHDKEVQNDLLEERLKTLQCDNYDLVEANKALNEKYESLVKDLQLQQQQAPTQLEKKLIRSINQMIKDFKQNLAAFKVQLLKFNDFYKHESQTNLNTQVITYMTEQMVHKAALNGHLKFACELLRKKCSDSLILIPNKNFKNDCISFVPSTYNDESCPSQQNLIKKLLKITSDLLLCDEDSLRKLSTQVLHEAEHLDQLNMVTIALKKIRSKQFSSFNSDSIKQIDNLFSKTQKILTSDNIKEIEFNNLDHISVEIDEKSTSDDDVFLYENNNSNELNNKNENLNYILNVMSEIYSQHKVQVCEQLNEVHKLMAISSDDDIFTHLQQENTRLQQELTNLKSSIENYSLKSLLSSTTNSNMSIQQSPTDTPTNAKTSFSEIASGTSIKTSTASTTSTKSSNMFSNIFNEFITQDDTVC